MKEIIIEIDNHNYMMEYKRTDNGGIFHYDVLFYNDMELIELLGNPFKFGISTHFKRAEFGYEVKAGAKRLASIIINAINNEDAWLNWKTDN